MITYNPDIRYELRSRCRHQTYSYGKYLLRNGRFMSYSHGRKGSKSGLIYEEKLKIIQHAL